MAAENHKGGRSPSVNPTKVDHSFYDLAKGLAGGTMSRLEAVRLVGAEGKVASEVAVGASGVLDFGCLVNPGPQSSSTTVDGGLVRRRAGGAMGVVVMPSAREMFTPLRA